MSNPSSRLILGACALALASAVAAEMAGAEVGYEAAIERTEANYEVAKAVCEQLSGNPKDICISQAKAVEQTARADAEAAYKPSVEQVVDARITKADGDYDVAKQLCDAHTGNAKDVCLKDAEAVHTTAIADAKADEKVAEIRMEASQDAREANYEAAKERCDSFAGDRKDACVAEAKARFGE